MHKLSRIKNIRISTRVRHESRMEGPIPPSTPSFNAAPAFENGATCTHRTWRLDMIRDMPKLRDQIVFLEVIDARHVGMNAKKYLLAARSVRTIIERELGGLYPPELARPSPFPLPPTL